MTHAETINTNVVKHVLEAFVEEFLVDVPAVHRDGEYLIKFDELEKHVQALTTDDLVNISFEAEERYAGE